MNTAASTFGPAALVWLIGLSCLWCEDGVAKPSYLRLDLDGLLPEGQALRLELSRRGTGIVTGVGEPGPLRCGALNWSATGIAGPVTGHATIDGQRRELVLTLAGTIAGSTLRGSWQGTIGGTAGKGALAGAVVRRRLWINTLDSSQRCFYDPAILVLDIDDGHRVAADQRPDSHRTSGQSGNSLGGLRGVAANPASDLYYGSINHGNPDKFYGRKVYHRGPFYMLCCVDLRTGKTVWEVPVGGANDPTLLFNGRSIYLPRYWTGACHPDDDFDAWKAKSGWGLESLMWELDATTGQVTRYFTDYRQVIDEHIRTFGDGGRIPEMLNRGPHFQSPFGDGALKKEAPFGFTANDPVSKTRIVVPIDPALLPPEANGPGTPRVGELGGRYGVVGNYDGTRAYYGPGGGKVARVLVFDLTGETPRHIGTWGRELAMTGSTLDGKNKSGAWPSKGGDLVWTSESWYFDAQTGEALGEWQDAKGKRFRCCKILEVHDVDGDVVWSSLRRGGHGLDQVEAGHGAVDAEALRRGWGGDLPDDLNGRGSFFLEDRQAAVATIGTLTGAQREAVAKCLVPLIDHAVLPVRLAAVDALRALLPESSIVRNELVTRLAKLAYPARAWKVRAAQSSPWEHRVPARHALRRHLVRRFDQNRPCNQVTPTHDLARQGCLRELWAALPGGFGALMADDLFALGRDPERYAAGHGACRRSPGILEQDGPRCVPRSGRPGWPHAVWTSRPSAPISTKPSPKPTMPVCGQRWRKRHGTRNRLSRGETLAPQRPDAERNP
jgi:hypothetical protein